MKKNISDVELIEVNGERLVFSENGFRLTPGNLTAMGLVAPTEVDAPTLLTEYARGTARHIQQRDIWQDACTELRYF